VLGKKPWFHAAIRFRLAMDGLKDESDLANGAV
jgi:hypothetical protein